MEFRCYNCGKKFSTTDIMQAYCERCEEKGNIKPDPNLNTKLAARAALIEGKTYGQYKGRKTL